MSTDKLQALHNTVAEILSEPPSPPTFFDEEPCDAALASEQVANASDNVRRGIEIPVEHFGKAPSREFGISPSERHGAHAVRDAKNEIPSLARQALAEQIPVVRPVAVGNQLASRLLHEAPGPRSDPQTSSANTFRSATSEGRIWLGGWALRGIAGILLAASIGAALISWLGSPGDAAKTALTDFPQPAPPAQAAPTAAAPPPELTPLLQSLARDLASMGKEIEQLKAGRDQMARDNANLSEQLKASQEQFARGVARIFEQLKASQEQAARDNANVAEQLRGIQQQLTSVMSRVSEPNAPPKTAAARPRPTPPSPQQVAPAARQSGPVLSTAQPTAQPKLEKPKPPSTSRPPPAR
ncbi:hypothetical protein [Bradyrhizobium sp. AUGA SZCCT0283]|uniref:hypothetical protein n=1 Tax=Bradyrhizobium sp. AUGA SZCCT0283 TaxID=2807671 RepID=UPI001BA4BCCC|nr:hypothetical protein [Bradyrhizobium sp. AUGA SZCCT0283]MBR1279269.1 hypothetical protein [Bradyrhizobium sp. AUGA SZCCT0283]